MQQATPLPAEFLASAPEHFGPLINHLVASAKGNTRPRVVGINGCQGSGKSTLARYLSEQLNAAGVASLCMSQDDFYLTKQARAQLARTVHPLLATRGVPGTHDVELACRTLQHLLAGKHARIPLFEKHLDDRAPEHLWRTQTTPLAVIIVEGWCMGCTPQTASELAEPVNALEAQEDARGLWRHYVNTALSEHYPQWFQLIDEWVMLRAPSFACVSNWRKQQEQALKAQWQASDSNGTDTHAGIMNDAQLARFIAHYQRLTEHMLRTLPERVQHLYNLDETRTITQAIHRI
ncbi:hypothetical protein L1F30_05850 [Simiduia sp. 21SJ11W-1]|uniref:hypothetical protein n=1 Tax=Simiduia sp. 21SJ11W-1 TaxID=2909669 RepID=UPI00209F7991|nr:hypothetical protein [Simiduia sp. 21SJ11W-1]UTA49071.1 hypothetical protein L1F30_05850 [Simiduia sp. 21SJ11W-1]